MILSILIALPLVGAGLAALFPQERASKALAFLASFTTFVFSLSLVQGFNPADGGFQFEEQKDLLPSLGIHYSLGMDGLSLWLILLTTFLTPWVLLASWGWIRINLRGYLASVLVLESAMIGTLASTDLFLFYLFWELMLVPVFFLMGIWGGPNRGRATLKFVLFTMLGSLLMLVALIYATHEAHSFDYTKLFEHTFPEDVQFWCFLAFSMAFLIKVPLFPFHAWLPDAYTEAPAGATALLSGVMVKLGVYGLLRFCIPLFPVAARDFAPWIMVLALAGVLHGALMAVLQTDFKRMAAYSSLSHMGLVLLGVFTYSLMGLQGGLIEMIGHGVAMTAFFLLIGALWTRRESHEAEEFGGLAKVAPFLAFTFLWTLLSVAGLPAFAGFPGEVLILLSTYKAWPLLAVLAIGGFVLTAWFLFHFYGRVFLGPLSKKPNQKVSDLSWSEILALLPLCLAALWVGLNPNLFIAPAEKTLQMKVIEKLKPPPRMTDFAAEQRHRQETLEKEKNKK
ncbi:MAG TPA: NADH-quinone oxidoreductase subunit M [bacterium]|nr:NADH-quinone oxidoreductase subunit M [bacterium]